MTKLFTKVQSAIAARRSDDEGAGMVEYGLLVARIAVVVAARSSPLGGRIADLFRRPTPTSCSDRGRAGAIAPATAPAARGSLFQFLSKEVQDDEATA